MLGHMIRTGRGCPSGSQVAESGHVRRRLDEAQARRDPRAGRPADGPATPRRYGLRRQGQLRRRPGSADARGCEANPTARIAARENRAFLRRAVRFLAAEAGVRQFLDIGTGLPTAATCTRSRRRSHPAARIVYVDNDPIVLTHARALLTSTPEGRTAYVDADLRDPATILAADAARRPRPRPPVGAAAGRRSCTSSTTRTTRTPSSDAAATPCRAAATSCCPTSPRDYEPEAWERHRDLRRQGITTAPPQPAEVARFFTGLDWSSPALPPGHEVAPRRAGVTRRHRHPGLRLRGRRQEGLILRAHDRRPGQGSAVRMMAKAPALAMVLLLVTALLVPVTWPKALQTFCTTDIVQARAVAGLANFSAWLRRNNATGFIGEIGWPADRDAQQWTGVAEAWYSAADAIGLPVTAWAAGTWPANYPMAVYRPVAHGMDVDVAGPQAKVVERHASAAGYLPAA